MFAGLPGTGVGGIFYLLLALWMPVREFARLLRGESSWARWRFIALHWSLFAAVIGVVWLQAAFMKWLIPASEQREFVQSSQATFGEVLHHESAGLMAGSARMALISLAVVVVLVHLLRMGLTVRRMGSNLMARL